MQQSALLLKQVYRNNNNFYVVSGSSQVFLYSWCYYSNSEIV